MWTEKQVSNLNNFQNSGAFHPFTCGGKDKEGKDCRSVLLATKDGWICPDGCGYTQNWAHEAMLNFDMEKFNGLLNQKIKVKWLIEDSNHVSNSSEIINCLNAKKIQYKTCSISNLITDLPQYDENDCVISIGTLSFIKNIEKYCKWIPGYFANFSNFDCLKYYSYYGKYLLNSEYYIMPFSEMVRRKNTLFPGVPKLFVRPCSGLKQFTGQELTQQFIDSYVINGGNTCLPVLVAPYVPISTEFRFFCTEKEIVSGSLYYNETGNFETVCIDDITEKNQVLFDNLQNCKNFVQNMLNDVSWKPDKIFAVDVGLSYGNVPRLIELNSFSCSGWYSSNCEKIIEAANSLAEIEYKGLF